jgi:hypothetical protein
VEAWWGRGQDAATAAAVPVPVVVPAVVALAVVVPVRAVALAVVVLAVVVPVRAVAPAVVVRVPVRAAAVQGGRMDRAGARARGPGVTCRGVAQTVPRALAVHPIVRAAALDGVQVPPIVRAAALDGPEVPPSAGAARFGTAVTAQSVAAPAAGVSHVGGVCGATGEALSSGRSPAPSGRRGRPARPGREAGRRAGARPGPPDLTKRSDGGRRSPTPSRQTNSIQRCGPNCGRSRATSLTPWHAASWPPT